MQNFFLKTFIITCGISSAALHAFSWADTKQTISNWVSTKNTVPHSQEVPFKEGQHIVLHNKRGNISVTTWNKPSVMIDTRKTGTAEELNNTTVSVHTANHTLTISTESSDEQQPALVDYTLVVPSKMNISIFTDEGEISIAGTSGHTRLQSGNGTINAEQIIGSLHAKALNGSIMIEQPLFNKNNDEASIFAEAFNTITLIMPENANTSIKAHTLKGTVLSDIFITLDPITVQLSKESYKQMQRSIRGTTGMGGIPVTLETTHGNIKIMGN